MSLDKLGYILGLEANQPSEAHRRQVAARSPCVDRLAGAGEEPCDVRGPEQGLRAAGDTSGFETRARTRPRYRILLSPLGHRVLLQVVRMCWLMKSLQPLVRMQCGFRWTFCSPSPVQKYRAPSGQTATSGVTCGCPSARTADGQNTSA